MQALCVPLGAVRAVCGARNCANVRVSRRCARTVVRATGEGKGQADNVDEYVNPFCSIDETGQKSRKKSLGEMEAEFLDAMASFYYDGKPIMSNEEFDNLKNELLWEGSTVVVLNGQEQRFLEASMAYAAGKPIMSDEEFNKLKRSLKKTGSVVTVGGPRCSIRSKKMYTDAMIDYGKMLALNLPAVAVVLGGIFAIDYASGFGISKIIEAPGPVGSLFLWAFLLPSIYVISSSLTNIVLRDGVILTAQCPSCGHKNNAYFGDIFVVEGARGSVEMDCEQCKSLLKWSDDDRLVEVVREGPAKKEAPAKQPAQV